MRPTRRSLAKYNDDSAGARSRPVLTLRVRQIVSNAAWRSHAAPGVITSSRRVPAAAWAKPSSIRARGTARSRGASRRARHQAQRAAERGAAAEGAVDAHLAEVDVQEVDRQRAALGVDPDELDHAASASPSRRPRRPAPACPPPRTRPPRRAPRSAPSRARAGSRASDPPPRARRAAGDLPPLLERIGEDQSAPAPRRRASTMVRSPMMPPPITTTVASRGIVNISSPERQQDGRLGERGGDRIEPLRQRMHAVAPGSAARSAKPPTRVALAHWLIRPSRAVQARAAPEARLAGDRPADESPADAATDLAHHARVLVAHHHRRGPREEALGRVHVGAADARGADTSTTTCPGPATGSGASSRVKRLPPRQVATFTAAPRRSPRKDPTAPRPDGRRSRRSRSR